MSYTFLDLALDVLSDEKMPLTYIEIWKIGLEKGFTKKLLTEGKTPWQSLGARIYVDIRDNPKSKLIKVGKNPARFFLASKKDEIKDISNEVIDKKESKSSQYKERDLHPVLTYFAYADLAFTHERPIYTKTIFHEKSTQTGYQGWTHPDIVGFSTPIEEWSADVLDFNEMTDKNALSVFSFELKKSITKTNYRESFFQAVSNSSWANQGYLVTAEIPDDNEELMGELDRLSSSFGIGIIHLNLSDIAESKVIYPAQIKKQLDWETINKIATQNSDFNNFLKSMKIDIRARKIHRSEYDEVVTDIDEYVVTVGKL